MFHIIIIITMVSISFYLDTNINTTSTLTYLHYQVHMLWSFLQVNISEIFNRSPYWVLFTITFTSKNKCYTQKH